MRWIRNELRGVLGVRSKHVIYDIGTEILCQTCFGHNSTQNEWKSMIFSGSCTEFYVDSESAIKTRFKALFKNRYPWIRNYRFRKSLHFWQTLKYKIIWTNKKLNLINNYFEIFLRYFLNDSEILFNNFQRLFNEFEMFF